MNEIDERKKQSAKLMKKHPGKYPLIINSNSLKTKVQKYIVSDHITLKEVINQYKKNVKLSENQALFIFINNKVLPVQMSTVGDIYEKYKNEDGFLYINIEVENTFG